MNNQEKAWMLCGQRVMAYKSYRNRRDWPRKKIHDARKICQAAEKIDKVEWAADPEIKVLVQDELDKTLAQALNGMSLTVGCLKGLMAGDRPYSDDYPMDEINAHLNEALTLMKEGIGPVNDVLPVQVRCPVCGNNTAYKDSDGLIACTNCRRISDDDD